MNRYADVWVKVADQCLIPAMPGLWKMRGASVKRLIRRRVKSYSGGSTSGGSIRSSAPFTVLKTIRTSALKSSTTVLDATLQALDVSPDHVVLHGSMCSNPHSRNDAMPILCVSAQGVVGVRNCRSCGQPYQGIQLSRCWYRGRNGKSWSAKGTWPGTANPDQAHQILKRSQHRSWCSASCRMLVMKGSGSAVDFSRMSVQNKGLGVIPVLVDVLHLGNSCALRVQIGKRSCGVVVLVIVSHGVGAAPLHEQARLRAVQRVSLGHIHRLLRPLIGDAARSARMRCILFKDGDTSPKKSHPPADGFLRRSAHPAGNLLVLQALGRLQHNARTLHYAGRRLTLMSPPPLHHCSLLPTQHNFNRCTHGLGLHSMNMLPYILIVTCNARYTRAD
jgi:hypothetical protein